MRQIALVGLERILRFCKDSLFGIRNLLQNETYPASKSRECIANETAVFFKTTKVINSIGDARRIRIGCFSYIRGELLIFGHGGDIQIGDYCYVGEGTRIWSADSIYIGNRVLISHNVNIFDNDTHPIDDPVARHKQFVDIITVGQPTSIDLKEKPIYIHDDVLICCQSIILKGVTIGEGAVVGAGSVVTQDVPPYTVVAGNPARFIRAIKQLKDK